MYPIGYALLSLEDFLSSIRDLVLTIIAVVIGEVALYTYFRARERPRIIIGFASGRGPEMRNMEFDISVKRHTVKNARVRCNNISYPWTEGDAEVDCKDLFVGDEPSSFFPFHASTEYVDDVTKYGSPLAHALNKGKKDSNKGVLVTVREVKTEKIVYSEVYPFPIDAFGLWIIAKTTERARNLATKFDVSIRIIGEGIEEVKDYSLQIRLKFLHVPVTEPGEPKMDDIDCSFELFEKKKSFLDKVRKRFK
jgi:hypothetical protein